MAAAGLNHNGGHGFDRQALAVELDEGLTFHFQDEIDLGEGLVVVRFGIERNVNVVNRRGRIIWCCKGALGHSAGAGDGVYFVEVGDAVVHVQITEGGFRLFQADMAHGIFAS